MKGILLDNIKKVNFVFITDSSTSIDVEYFELENLNTVIEHCCQGDKLRPDKFIAGINSNKIQLKFGQSMIKKEDLNSPIDNIDFNKRYLILDVRFDNTSSDDVKIKEFDTCFKMENSGKEYCVTGLDEAQTLKQIIKKLPINMLIIWLLKSNKVV